MTIYQRKPNVIESASGSSSSSEEGSTSGNESDSDSRSYTSDGSSYFSGQDVVELEMYELKCKTVQVAYEKYTNMVKYMCSVMLSQLTTMQKVISLVAPSADLAEPCNLDELMAAAAAGNADDKDNDDDDDDDDDDAVAESEVKIEKE